MNFNININELIEKFRRLPLIVRVLAVILACDAILVLAVYLKFDDVLSRRLDAVDDLQTRLSKTREDVATTRKDINRLPELQRDYDAAMAAGITGVKDHLKLVQMAQEIGARYHLSQFHYKLDADRVDAIPAGAPASFRQSRAAVEFESAAFIDTEAVAFWDSVLAPLPGYYMVTEASIERIGTPDAAILSSIRTGSPVNLVKTKLAFEWATLLPPGKE